MTHRRLAGCKEKVCGEVKTYIAECNGVKKDYPILKSGKDKFFEWGSYENNRRNLKIKIKEDAGVEAKLYTFCYFAEYADVP